MWTYVRVGVHSEWEGSSIENPHRRNVQGLPNRLGNGTQNLQVASWSIPRTTEKKIINELLKSPKERYGASSEEIRRIHGLRIIPARFDKEKQNT
jgi:hypothetical protein